MFVAQAVRVGVQITSVVVLSRLLEPADFGLVAMVLAIANIATVVGDFGLSAAAIQSQTITQQQRSNLLWTNVVLGSSLALVIAALGQPLALFYDQPKVAGLTHAVAISFLFSAAAAQFRAELSKNLRFGRLAAIDIISPLIAIVAAIGAAVGGWGPWALIVQPVVLALSTFVLSVVLAGWKPSLPRRAPMRGLYGFGAGTLGVQVITYVSTNIDDVLVGKFGGPVQAGFYSRAYQLFRLPMQQVAVPAARVALPVLARIQDDKERFEAYVLRGQLLLAYGFGGTFCLLAACTDPLIDIALGPGWGPAKPIFIALAVGGVFQSITIGYWWMFQAKGLTTYLLKFSLFGRSVMVLMLFGGLPWGAIGVACASAAGQAVMWVLYTGLAVQRAGVSRRRLSFQALAPVTAGLSAAAVGVSTGVLCEGMVPVAQLALVLAAFAAWLGVLVLVVPRVRQDARIVLETLRRAR